MLNHFSYSSDPDKPLLAVRALLKAHELSPAAETAIEPSVFVALAELKHRYLLSSSQPDGTSRETESTSTTKVLEKALETIEQLEVAEGYGGRLARAESFIIHRTNHPPSGSNTPLDSAEVYPNEVIEEEIFSLFGPSNEDHGVLLKKEAGEWKTGLQGMRLLERCGSSRVEEFRMKACQLWSFVEYFQPAQGAGKSATPQLHQDGLQDPSTTTTTSSSHPTLRPVDGHQTHNPPRPSESHEVLEEIRDF